VLRLPELGEDPRFATNAARVKHRGELVTLLQERLRTDDRDAWLARLNGAGVSATPVHDLPDALRDLQARALGTVASYLHPTAGEVPFVRSPLRHHAALSDRDDARRALSDDATPPPRLGEHTATVLRDHLGLSDAQVEELASEGAFGSCDGRT
jgi:formyl-CoA transferase